MAQKNYSLSERTIDVYFQKSFRFLYPLLQISAAHKIEPIDTYLIWTEGGIRVGQHKLICVYKLRADDEFRQFEKLVLKRNVFFEDYKETTDNTGAYIFDLSKFKQDVGHFVQGKYSRISNVTRQLILDFYKANHLSVEYMDSFMRPHNYFHVYALLLNVDFESLKEVGELCDPPNMQLETLTVKVLEPKFSVPV